MLTVLRGSWALMLGILLIMIGNGLQGTLLGVRGTIENIDPSWMGLVMSAYFVGFLGGSQVAPILLARVGHVRVFAALGSLVSAAFILYAVYVDPFFWWFLRFVVGFCLSGLYVVAESWINDSTTTKNRGQALSLYVMIQMAGIVIGQLLLNVSDPGGYGLFVLISVLVSIAFAPILLSTTPAPVFQTSKPMPLRELMRVSPLGCVGIFLLGGIFSALFGMASIYAAERGLSILEISWFTMAIYTGGMLLQFPIGWFSDRMDRRTLIVIITALATVSSIMGMMVGESLWVLIGIALLVGGTTNPLYALLLAYVNDHLEYEQMSSASGGLIFINGVGAMGGPILVGYLINHIGPNGFFLFIAILSGMICLYSLYRMTQSDAIAVEDTGAFVPLHGASTAIASELAIEVQEELQMEEELSEIEELANNPASASAEQKLEAVEAALDTVIENREADSNDRNEQKTDR
uniref:Transporter, Major facilitator superfamily n=1 Tax=uncultured Thiotrichaceae bacterium TaxID=298394 RepID=A0A6S6S2Y3_9GAMM|nr:MAG: Transporter, Major facilitator superfamily [uncultured Thiotrichaceae bacterium]